MKKLIIPMLLLCGCVPATQITASWKNPDPPKNPVAFKSVIVTSLSQNLESRQMVEKDLAAAISKTGIKALTGMETFPPTFRDKKEVDKEELLDKIRKTKVDGIVTVALINKETETRYVPGTYSYAPVTRYNYYGRFTGYYTTWYPTMYDPGYYEENQVYFIEVNFYDVKSEDLVWSAQSETYNPASLSEFSKQFAAVIVDKMKRDGVLK